MNRTISQGAVVLAPHGRDAKVAESMLREAGLAVAVVPDVPALAQTLRGGAGFAVVTEEALKSADLRKLAEFVAEQEEWSDFPFIILTARGGGLERNPGAARLLETLGNVTFLERPFHPTTLVSLARAALRARLRQYEARTGLEGIRAGEERLRVALGAAKLGAWSMDLASWQLNASPQCKSHYGRGADAPFPYAELIASIHPDDRERMQAAVRATLSSGTDYEIEYRCIWPEGSIHWVRVNGRVEKDLRGEPRLMVGVSQDITKRRQIDDRRGALLALGDGLRQLSDPVEMSALATRILGQTLDVSRAGYGVIDRAAETINIERNWMQPGSDSIAGLLHFRDYGSYIENLKRGETVAIADARTDPRTADTAEMLETIHARSFINMPLVDHGDFVALIFVNHRDPREWSDSDVAFMRDVADRTQAAIERRNAEASLAELAASLEQQVIDRTRESEDAQEQLRQAQKMEAVGQLTGGLAHDFNNMLAGVSGGLEMIAQRVNQNRPEEIGKYLEMAQAGTRRAAALTHRLLAFSRRQTLDPKPIEVDRLVASMADFLRRSVGPAVDVEVVSTGGIWTALLDPSQVENALLNLSINARDAMPEGGTVTIATTNTMIDERSAGAFDLDPGDYVKLSVTDTGTGMSAETQARAFDPFFTTKPMGEGTGLGLSMIYGFVRQSGGQIRIHSQLGAGTTMSLYFPRVVARQAADDDAPDRTADESGAGGGETVLVVDDEPIIRLLIADLLEEMGYSAIEAGDGHEGLAALETLRKVDLLITDVGLPKGINGRQLADAARVARPDLKVLFITGYAENAVLGDGSLEPGMHIMTKPFKMDALAAKVRDLVHG